ncbi:MAG: imidazole glycerol phosphate synthase subunit HisH [Candidatus Nezhaarchaeota archaeon]|nr:imidazole glycerol phosphate synthase subunit HisH [Candidatus Nezhaarchaeota archaeon]MCX8141309.1 imidazole glycerol phosphate synthase subunit HisH [Candidatus Nezhaarchaeota archaeon]MDW8049575.1 imidazole glycerol phosphate synthase subunit HisH [Nitrososphaerota archaeon]
MVTIAIIDYGAGNLRSVKRAFEKVGATVSVTLKPEDIAMADAIVLPGVGSFKSAMENLKPIIQLLYESMREGKPMLGICLGLHLYFEWSEEGWVKGLSFIEGYVDRLPNNVKVPHMGWNTIKVEKASPLIDNVPSGAYVYFVHSYKVNMHDNRSVIATTNYGVEFPSIIDVKSQIFGTQFHPEKSGKIGLTMLKNFVELIRR